MTKLIESPELATGGSSSAAQRSAHPVLDVVIPVYNEQVDLAPSVRRLYRHLRDEFPYPFRITIADNASTDATPELAEHLARELPGVRVMRIEQKGRGLALRTAWSASDAEVLAYMDVDLSTDLAALLPLVAPLVSGHSEMAIGSRLSRSSRVVRGTKREVISRCYNLILRGTLATRFSDAQCGFKAIRADVAQALLPLVQDTGWFFDTELLVLAERSGLRIHEVPVDWVDDPDSRVDILATAVADLKGVARLGTALVTGRLPLAKVRNQLGREPASSDRAVSGATVSDTAVPGVPSGMFGQLIRFGVIGVVSTLAYLLLYLAFRGAVGAQAANLLALLITAVGNTAANRALTFGVRGRDRAMRHQVQGLAVLLVGLALTSGSLALLHTINPEPARAAELAVLVGANLASTVLRFVLFRSWVFPGRRDPGRRTHGRRTHGQGSADPTDLPDRSHPTPRIAP